MFPSAEKYVFNQPHLCFPCEVPGLLLVSIPFSPPPKKEMQEAGSMAIEFGPARKNIDNNAQTPKNP